MHEIYDFLPSFNTKKCVINYNFYYSYLNNNRFNEQFKKRLNYIKNTYDLKYSDDYILQNYFVEIFSWSVIPKNMLVYINSFLKSNNILKVIDPCCGNAFHTFLFNTFCNLDVLSIDIQKEPFSWINSIEMDGIKFLNSINFEEHKNGALLLSWIDTDTLALNLLKNFKGNVVISIGNYEGLSPNYLRELNYNYELKEKIILKMPWGLTEQINIYV